jgi:hypothetical protein
MALIMPGRISVLPRSAVSPEATAHASNSREMETTARARNARHRAVESFSIVPV